MKEIFDKKKKDHPTLWKIQFYMESMLLSIGSLIVIVAITMFVIYWLN